MALVMPPKKPQLVFTPLEKSGDNLYEPIVAAIKMAMRSGELSPGDRLPSERDLADAFGVSRVPVREALKVLEYLGVVQQTRGKGVYVRQVEPSQIFQQVNFFVSDPCHSLAHLFEARQILEVEATSLAAQRRDENDLFALRSAILEMEHRIATATDIVAVSTKFHCAVIAAAHNPILTRMYAGLADLLEYSRERTLSSPLRHERVLDFHRSILAAIVAGDPIEARRVAALHLEEAKTALPC